MGRSLLLVVFIIAAFFELGTRQQPKQQNQAANRQKGITTIFLVRHAEKETTNPAEKDPDLTAAGLQRAQDLKQYLQHTPVDAFFSTPYKRTQKTLFPLAKGRPVQYYDAHDFEGLQARVLENFKGKTIVIVGHSNTLLPIIKAFGAKSPLEQLDENQYDNLFKLQVSRWGKASVQALKFGALTSLVP
jgi:2,3-bisphosphoglycerate-dependent phosphoglycerate mutase